MTQTGPALKMLKVKLGRDCRSGNHSQTLTLQLKKSLSGDLNGDSLPLAILNNMAARQTERLYPQIGRQVGEIPGSAIKPSSPSGTDDHSERDGYLKSVGHWEPDGHNDAAWLFDPPDNSLRNVVLGIQQFASDILVAQGVQWELTAPPDLDRIKLTTEQCRHVFMIFQEALQNIVRHSRCSTVSFSVSIGLQKLEVKIHDNGRGLIGQLLRNSAIHMRSGGGLRNIQMWAEKLEGALEIASAYKWGTSLTLTLPLNE